MRTRTSSQKRQREIARMEKQREKSARRIQRKLEPKRPDEFDINAPPSAVNPAETEPANGSE